MCSANRLEYARTRRQDILRIVLSFRVGKKLPCFRANAVSILKESGRCRNGVLFPSCRECSLVESLIAPTIAEIDPGSSRRRAKEVEGKKLRSAFRKLEKRPRKITRAQRIYTE